MKKVLICLGLKRGLTWVLLCLVLGAAHAQPSKTPALTFETWRYEDMDVWRHHILPSMKDAPIQLEHVSVHDPVKHDADLLRRLGQGQGGDVIACRPFDRSLELYDKGYLEDLTDMQELRRFRLNSKIAWTTYYNERVFCMPIASVMTGFFYNKAIFEELKLTPPETEEALWEVMSAIQKSGKYQPLAYGTQDRWQASQVLFSGIGPNYWKGEEGRLKLLMGRGQFTDKGYVETWRVLKKLGQYLPKNHANISGYDARKMFLNGQAAIYPAGSWEVRFLENQAGLRVGVFAPPPPTSTHNCFVLNHFDQGIGINAQSPRANEARTLLSWMSTQEFSIALASHLHGFFPLSNYPVHARSPLGREMLSWTQQCDTTIRINSQYLDHAWPGMDAALWDISTRVLTQEISPEQAAQHIADGVKKWFKPI
jgi:raffinose/stachyose/melibiose transport system substrate-binding protein